VPPIRRPPHRASVSLAPSSAHAASPPRTTPLPHAAPPPTHAVPSPRATPPPRGHRSRAASRRPMPPRPFHLGRSASRRPTPPRPLHLRLGRSTSWRLTPPRPLHLHLRPLRLLAPDAAPVAQPSPPTAPPPGRLTPVFWVAMGSTRRWPRMARPSMARGALVHGGAAAVATALFPGSSLLVQAFGSQQKQLHFYGATAAPPENGHWFGAPVGYI
jgi:hypothetical protein